jgi:hypothetical protein
MISQTTADRARAFLRTIELARKVAERLAGQCPGYRPVPVQAYPGHYTIEWHRDAR